MSLLRRRLFRSLLRVERVEERIAPALFTVTNLLSSGPGSLRAAIASANAAAGADTIDFASGLTGVLNINGATGDDLQISGPLEIVGPGAAKLQISAGKLSRIFDTSPAPANTPIKIAGLGLINGRAVDTGALDSGDGGAIFIQDERVTIIGCNITGNTSDKSGGGIALGAQRYLVGGISGSLTIQNSAISGNSAAAGSGGGISVYGDSFRVNASRYHYLSISDSVISGNIGAWENKTSLRGGGGLYFRGRPSGGEFTVSNTLITDNSSQFANVGGAVGLFEFNGVANFFNSTLAYNTSFADVGPGIRRQDSVDRGTSATITLSSSIISNNIASSGVRRAISSQFAGLGVGSVNSFVDIIDVGNFVFSGFANQTGTLASPLDAKLDTPKSNGGPFPTRMPLPTSAVINKGLLNTLTTDVRGTGFPRSLDGQADMGAVEFTEWVVRSDNSSGPGTLRQRVLDANAFAGPNTITFDPSVFGTQRAINLGGSETVVSESLTIVGMGSDSLTLTAGGVRLFNVSGAPTGTVFELSGVTVEASSLSAADGAAILAKDQTVIVADCEFTKLSAVNGGAIAFQSSSVGELQVIRSSFDQVSATNSGGAIFFASGGKLTVTGSTFVNNRSLSSSTANSVGGGAIAFNGTAFAPIIIRNSTFTANSATGQGGALLFNSMTGSVNIQNSTIVNNTSSGALGGGGVSRVGVSGTINFESSIVASNVAANSADDVSISGQATAVATLFGTTAGSVFASKDATTTALVGKNPLLAPVATFGNNQRAFPLLPGSPALGLGFNPGALTVDIRGLPRVVGAIDIGAVESQGFNVVVQSGSGQTTDVNTAFPSALIVNVTAKNPTEVVNGGVLSWATPAGGAGATLSASTTTITAGSATVTATANAVGGSYTVTATADAGATATFSLNNRELQSLTVNTASDAVNNLDGVTSLREAIAFANTKIGPDTITFDPAVFSSAQTITLGSPLAISEALTIPGPGADLLTVSGNNATRIFRVDSPLATPQTNVISGLRLAFGRSLVGSAVAVFGGEILTLSNCVITGNSATSPTTGGAIAVYTSGNLTLQNCTVNGNTSSAAGGALFVSSSSVTIRNSTISGNSSASSGGAGYIFGTVALNVRNSTIVNNAAALGGGGFFLKTGSSSLTLDNSIVSGNSGGSGSADIAAPAVIAANSAIGSTTGITTLTNNGGNILDLPHASLRLGALGGFGGKAQTIPLLPGSPLIDAGATTVTLDQRGQSRVGSPDIGAFESQGFTLTAKSGTPQTTPINQAFASPLVVTVAAKNAVEPVDGGVVSFAAPVAGPSATLGASTATIAGGAAWTTATANNTGGSYTVDATLIGTTAKFALTNQPPEAPSFIVTTNLDVVDAFDNLTSLREALTQSNNFPGTAIITFESTVFGVPRVMTLASALSVTDAVIIAGPGANLLTISGNKAVRVMTIDTPSSGQKITLSGLTIANGTASQGGGIFVNGENLVLQNCAMFGNSASNDGGAVFAAPGSGVVLEGSAVTGNSSPRTGAIYVSGSATIRNSTISNNTSTVFSGGGLNLRGSGPHVFENATIVGNTATLLGGGVFAISPPLTVTNSVISGNAAGSGGGDVNFSVAGGVVTATNSAIGSVSGATIDNKGGNILNQPHASLRLAALGSYGGPTQTIAPLPGSPLINAGSSTIAIDQRGLARVGAADIGAFESQGFTITAQSGGGQSAQIGTAFAIPLTVTVAAKNAVEPVNGGVITFAGAATGPSVSPASATGTIVTGSASVAVTANAVAGSHTVTATAPGGTVASFALGNAEPQSLVVNTAADVVDPFDLLTSLREAIGFANAKAGTDTITFDATAFGSAQTITLNGTEIAISGATTVSGPAAGVTLNAAGKSRIFNTTAAPALAKISFSRLTLTGGTVTGAGGATEASGGAVVASDESLTFTDCVLIGNTVAGDGGAVAFFADGFLTLERSTLSGNAALGGVGTQYKTASTGGAVFFFNGGGFLITNSTISGNTASGGGIFGGGGIYFYGTPTSATILNSTIANNSAANGGGIGLFNSGGSLTVVSSTVVNNSAGVGGGIGRITGAAGTISLTGTLVSGNTAATGPDVSSTGKVNATNSAFSSTAGFTPTGAGNQVAAHSSFRLAPLGAYGGPTQSFALLPGSPLIDAGSSTLTTDQRGSARLGAPDVGAFESQGFTVTAQSGGGQSAPIGAPFANPLVATVTAKNAVEPVNGGAITFAGPPTGASIAPGTVVGIIVAGSASASVTANGVAGNYAATATTAAGSVANFALTNVGLLVVSTTADTVNPSDGVNSLREAIAFANSSPGPDTITFDQNVFAASQTITLGGTELSFLEDAAIEGPNAGVTINAAGKSRIFNTSPALDSAKFSFSRLTLTGGSVAGVGGSSDAIGGAVRSSDESVTFTDCVLIENTAAGDGGAIAFDSVGFLTLDRSSVIGNAAVGGTGTTFDTASTGGAIAFLSSGGFLIANSTISGNTASGGGIYGGGALYFWNAASSATIRNSTIANNSAASGGGIALVNFNGTLTVASSSVVGNSATTAGGIGRLSGGGSIVLTGALVSGNTAAIAPDILSGGNTTANQSAFSSPAGFTPVGSGNQIAAHATFRVAPLGAYGGPTQTIALLPGSPLIDAGSSTLTTDQRGSARLGAPDVGAFESQGFTVTATSGGGQSTPFGTAFVSPLVATVTAKNAGEPVNGGAITFTGSPTGASINPATVVATIAAGSASASVAANATTGAHTVTATTPIGTTASFALVNGEAASLVVNTAADVVDPLDLVTSLREAINLANAKGGADTISFDPAVFGTAKTITLGSTLSITDAVTITGPGANLLTISGNKAVRVMTIDTPSSGQKITLSDLTIANGFSVQGAGIFLGDESLLLRSCAVTNNSASGSSGAILAGSDSSVVMEGCVVSGNAAPNAGGVESGGALLIRNSTISKNVATSTANGGILITSSGSLVIESSSVVANTAVVNSGGIFSNSSFTSINSVISGNVNGAGASDVFLNFTEQIFATASAIGAVLQGMLSDLGGNILNQPHASLRLAAIGSYGGPTQTIALLPGSPLINAGSSTITTDQRGLARVGAPDIGAFESQGFTITVQSGNLQTAALGAAFANPLVASVTAKNAVEPVNGGAVSFTAPASGASATPAAQAVTITGGTATAPLTANATAGFYVVNATANGAGTAQFGLTNGSAAAAKVASVVVGDGSSQRSTVRQLVVNFDSPVLTSGTPASAFSLKRQSDNAVVSLAVAMSPSNTTATITFTGGPLEFGSLADGRYTLGILAGPFSGPGLDGNGNGVGGDDYTLVGDPAAAPRLFRLFGDADGNGTVNSADFLAFRLAFLSSNPTFDFDNNGTVDSADFLALRLNFLKSI